MRASARFSAPVMVAALAFGGLAVAVAPSAAACGNYGEPACQTFVLSFNANGGVCSPSSVSATENTWATLLGSSQCTRSGFSLTSWTAGSSSFAPGSQVFVTGNNGFTAVWTSTTPTSSPTATPTGGTSTPTTGPTEEPTASPTPTVTIPPGQTNPDTPQRPAPGVVVVSQTVADRTPVTEERSFVTRRAAERGATDVDRGSVFQAGVTGLIPQRQFTLRLQTPDGEFVDFGTFRSNRNGELITPAVRYTADGIYLWIIERNDGVRRYLGIAVR